MVWHGDAFKILYLSGLQVASRYNLIRNVYAALHHAMSTY